MNTLTPDANNPNLIEGTWGAAAYSTFIRLLTCLRDEDKITIAEYDNARRNFSIQSKRTSTDIELLRLIGDWTAQIVLLLEAHDLWR